MLLSELSISGLSDLIKGTAWRFVVNECSNDCSQDFYSHVKELIEKSSLSTDVKVKFIDEFTLVSKDDGSFLDRFPKFKNLVFDNDYVLLINDCAKKLSRHVMNYSFMIDNYKGFIDSKSEPVEFSEFISRLDGFSRSNNVWLKKASYGFIRLVNEVVSSYEDSDPHVVRSYFSPKSYMNARRLVLTFPLNAPVSDVKDYLSLMPARKEMDFSVFELLMLKRDYERK